MTPLQERIAGPVRTTLLFLSAAVAVVMLIACTNIANLRLAQARTRQREFAMRAVLGAASGRLRRQVLTESLVMAVVGGVLGLLIARLLLRGLLALYPGQLPRASEIHVDSGIIVWSLAVAVLASVLFAVPQLMQLVRMDAGSAVKDGERGSSTRAQRFARRALVVVQLAFSVVMLVASGLLVRTFLRVTRVEAGFDASGVLSFAVAASQARYPTFQATEQLYRDIDERLRALPGVRAVGATNAVPLTVNPWRNGVPVPASARGSSASE